MVLHVITLLKIPLKFTKLKSKLASLKRPCTERLIPINFPIFLKSRGFSPHHVVNLHTSNLSTNLSTLSSNISSGISPNFANISASAASAPSAYSYSFVTAPQIRQIEQIAWKIFRCWVNCCTTLLVQFFGFTPNPRARRGEVLFLDILNTNLAFVHGVPRFTSSQVSEARHLERSDSSASFGSVGTENIDTRAPEPIPQTFIATQAYYRQIYG